MKHFYQYLTFLLLEAGFKEARIWEPTNVLHHDFEDTTSNVWELFGKSYPISLNIEAVKWK